MFTRPFIPSRSFRPERIDSYYSELKSKFIGKFTIPFTEKLDEHIYVYLNKDSPLGYLYLTSYRKQGRYEQVERYNMSDFNSEEIPDWWRPDKNSKSIFFGIKKILGKQ